jgi:chromosome segregation ATPase
MKFDLHFKVLLLLGTAFAIGFTLPNVADAAEKKDKAARRAQLMMQKMKQDMEAEKATMQAQFDTEKKGFEDKLKTKDEELVAANGRLNLSEKKNKSLDSEVKKLSTEKASVETKQQQTQAELDTTKTSLADLKQQYQQAQTDLKFNDSQRKTLASNLSDTTKAMNSCEEKNTKLHQFGTDLIKLYDDPNSYEAAMRKEKFFQLKRVELENILQSKKDALDEAKFTSRKSAY